MVRFFILMIVIVWYMFIEGIFKVFKGGFMECFIIWEKFYSIVLICKVFKRVIVICFISI